MCWPAVVKSEWELSLDCGQSPHAYVNQRLQIQLELLMMSGMPLETRWAFNERWNNKSYYKVASCWLFLLSHTMMHGSMNIKHCNEMPQVGGWNLFYVFCTTFAFFVLIFSVLRDAVFFFRTIIELHVCLYVQCMILLTGHNTLRRHLYLIGLSDSPLCRRCGVEEETSAHILCECEALALLRHVYLGCCFLDPEDIKSINLGNIWKFSKVTGFL